MEVVVYAVGEKGSMHGEVWSEWGGGMGVSGNSCKGSGLEADWSGVTGMPSKGCGRIRGGPGGEWGCARLRPGDWGYGTCADLLVEVDLSRVSKGGASGDVGGGAGDALWWWWWW